MLTSKQAREISESNIDRDYELAMKGAKRLIKIATDAGKFKTGFYTNRLKKEDYERVINNLRKADYDVTSRNSLLNRMAGGSTYVAIKW